MYVLQRREMDPVAAAAHMAMNNADRARLHSMCSILGRMRKKRVTSFGKESLNSHTTSLYDAAGLSDIAPAALERPGAANPPRQAATANAGYAEDQTLKQQLQLVAIWGATVDGDEEMVVLWLAQLLCEVVQRTQIGKKRISGRFVGRRKRGVPSCVALEPGKGRKKDEIIASVTASVAYFEEDEEYNGSGRRFVRAKNNDRVKVAQILLEQEINNTHDHKITGSGARRRLSEFKMQEDVFDALTTAVGTFASTAEERLESARVFVPPANEDFYDGDDTDDEQRQQGHYGEDAFQVDAGHAKRLAASGRRRIAQQIGPRAPPIAAELPCTVCLAVKDSQSNAMLLCDGCLWGACHLKCCSPPLAAVPDGDWFCAKCIGGDDGAVVAEEDEGKLKE